MFTQEQIINVFVTKLIDQKINAQILKEYVEYCSQKDMGYAIKGETNHHHIIPRCGKSSLFEEYKSLSKCPWNGVHLMHYDHYYAHYLLCCAIQYPPFLYSFISMHYKNRKMLSMHDVTLINREEFNIIFKERNKKISQDKNTLVYVNGQYMTKAKLLAMNRKPLTDEQQNDKKQRMVGKNNIVYNEGVVDKIRTTKINTILDGKNMDEVGAMRAANTMKKTFIKESGEVTSIYKETSKKISLTLNAEIVDKDGQITTKAKQRGKKHSMLLRKRSKLYILKNVFDDTVNIILDAKSIRDISPGLETKTKENYLGSSTWGRNDLIKKQKQHLIGLYVEEFVSTL